METDTKNGASDSRQIREEGIRRFPDRLKEVIGQESVRSFARKCDMSEAGVRRYFSGETEPSRTTLIAMADAAGVRVEWLATGEGPKGREAEKTQEGPQLDADEFVLVPRYDVRASAGHGELVQSEQVVDHLAFRRRWVRDMGLQADQLALITAKGDSMEPTIREGFLLLVDLRQHQVSSDGIYVLRLDHDLIAKRLQKLFGGAIKIKSDNPAYDEQQITADQAGQLSIIGRVVWGGGRM